MWECVCPQNDLNAFKLMKISRSDYVCIAPWTFMFHYWGSWVFMIVKAAAGAPNLRWGYDTGNRRDPPWILFPFKSIKVSPALLLPCPFPHSSTPMRTYSAGESKTYHSPALSGHLQTHLGSTGPAQEMRAYRLHWMWLVAQAWEYTCAHAGRLWIEPSLHYAINCLDSQGSLNLRLVGL